MDKKRLIILLLALSLYSPSLSFAENAGVNTQEVTLKTGAFKISLPEGWQQRENKPDSISAVFVKKEVNSKLDILKIDIVDIGYNTLYNTSSYQKSYLEKIKKEAYEGKEGYDGGEYTELFGVPTLITNSHRKDKTGKIKEWHFLKDCKFYSIAFASYNEYFDILLPEIEKVIKNIEFIK